MSEYKLILLGEPGVGKSCIKDRFIYDIYEPYRETTLSNPIFEKTMSFKDGKKIKFVIWDTCGQEIYRALTRYFYKNAKAIILVYDITNKESFEEMKKYWYNEIKKFCNSDVILAIAANKNDLYKDKKIEDSQGEEFANKINAIFSSTSAKNSNGIEVLFENIAQKILDHNFDCAANGDENKEKYKMEKQQEIKQNAQKSNNYSTCF